MTQLFCKGTQLYIREIFELFSRVQCPKIAFGKPFQRDRSAGALNNGWRMAKRQLVFSRPPV
jgi:hypothetical protein